MPVRMEDGPPPSTYAAQIVHNLENANERPQLSGSRTQLTQLFKAVLALDTNDLVDDETFETNLAINHRLIWTIVKGCLDLQGTSNPFDSHGETVELAKDGLSVINVTVKRYPEVVFTTLAKDTAYAAPEGPLFVWVVPRLLTLLHQQNDSVVQDRAQELLHRMLDIQKPTSMPRSRRQPILMYLQGCVDDILQFLLHADPLQLSDSGLELPIIPSINTIRQACGEELWRIVSRVDAENIAQALSIALSSLWVVIEHLSSRPLSVGKTFLRWMIRCLETIQSILCKIPITVQDGIPLAVLSLKISGAILERIGESSQDSVGVGQLLQILCRTLADAFQILMRNRNYTTDNLTQIQFSISLHLLCSYVKKQASAWKAYNQYLQGALYAVQDNQIFDTLEENLQALIEFTIRFMAGTTEGYTTSDAQSFEEALQGQLNSLVSRVHQEEMEMSSSPPFKRQRMTEISHATERSDFRTIYLNAIGMQEDNSASLPQIIAETFAELNEVTQRDMIKAAGEEACLLSESIIDGECQTCSKDEAQNEIKLMDSTESTNLGDVLVGIIRIVQEQKSPGPRVQAMLALRRFLAHCSSKEYIDLRTSTLAAWPLQSLKSSIRSLRIASVSAITHLISGSIPEAILRANRMNTLDTLRSLSEKDITLQEISVVAHGRIAGVIKGEDEINLCLLRLVEFLGHSNSFIANLAYEELQQLCSHNPSTAMRLFEPYWRTLATVIVKDLQNRPQICQMVCELLGISIANFLRLTQFHTIPFLILRRQSEILRRIAEANPETSLLEICSNRDQLAVTLAYILLQPSDDPEGMIRSLLSQVSEDFSDIDLQYLLRSDPTRIAFELLQVASADLEETKARARHGLLILAEKIQGKPSRKYSALDIFFEESSLGIMQLISEVVSQIKGAQPVGNRRRCIGAIKEMALIAGHHLLNALPQISACLRSAIEDKDLCNEAFGAWMTLMNSIDAEDEVGTMVDPTFAMIAQYWDSFSTEIQRSAHDLINALIKNRSQWIQDRVLSIPSLEGIPLLSKFESELKNIREKTDPRFRLEAFAARCQNDNATVVAQALDELPAYLLEIQPYIYNSVISEQPDPSIGGLIKALLDSCVRFATKKEHIAREAARCLGLVGCLDPARIELPHAERELFVLSDFVNSEETLEFVIFFLEEVLVKTFLAETDTRAQGLLSYAIQELLKICGFEAKNTINKNLQPDQLYQRWRNMDEVVRDTLTPFLTSGYKLEPLANIPDSTWPIYSMGMNHSIWLRQIVFSLLGKSLGNNATVIFLICRRIIRRQNIAIPAFLLPYITLNIIFQGTMEQVEQLSQEFLVILSTPPSKDQAANESLILCSQDVFRTLDYMSRWLRERKKTKDYLPRVGVASLEEAQQQELSRLEPIERFLKIIPAEIISDRAIQCKNFSRAILHWEAHIREKRKDETISRGEMDQMYSKLQNIYNSIDEPDGIQGISARIINTTSEQQMLEHKKAGRWNALQGWYEVELNKHPESDVLQMEFLTTLKETGQHDALIDKFTALKMTETSIAPLTELMAETAWTTSRWNVLNTALTALPSKDDTSFNVGIGRILIMLQGGDRENFKTILERLRLDALRRLSVANTKSIQSCHEIMLKLQILSEVEELASPSPNSADQAELPFAAALLQRAESLGALPTEQQKLLSVQRAMVDVIKLDSDSYSQSASWLMTAKLARQNGFAQYAFNAIFRASDDNGRVDMAYTIEDARLLWSEGHHIKAIHNLRTAIEAGSFGHPDAEEAREARRRGQTGSKLKQNPLAAKAHLILAKWLDHAGQTQSEIIIEQYQTAITLHNRAENSHYHLGSHYNKLLESEKTKQPAKQAQAFITGEMSKLVIENFLRSMAMGAKYVHQTLPRILTLWLELGNDLKKPVDASYGNDANFLRHVETTRQRMFKLVMGSVKKYIDRLPAYVFYTAFSQVLARICHSNESVCSSLVDIVAKVVVAHPQQAMWSLLALIKSKKQENRVQRGKECWTKVQDSAKKLSDESLRSEIVNLMKQGQRLSDQLLSLSNKDLGKKHGIVSLSNDLGFSHSKSSHCRLAIPVEAMLNANLPTPKENARIHKAFPKETITIDTFLDDVLVLNSLIKPKKVTIRGSNGRTYGILCKPKDDLRKDQRLLEFNSMITRLLKRDAQSSKRRLYIKTYAVTPLNEECGLIEWVEGVRPLRDILLDIYKQRNVRTDYAAIKEILDAISANKDEAGRFESEVLKGFPPVFHAWFTDMFPEPSVWFEARLRYTRSCAVMSMVGYVLGLGDRHGENILFQGENGGTFHVDFNCLFDKGLTFEKPERVPFRLTHNMVDAFGVYGYEGPFRKSCELSLGILRQHEHALMTILETFVHDPTTDFIGKKRKANPIVPDTPEGVLEAVRNKVRGLVAGESVPLSVEGHVELLIQEATDSYNLAAMYIGWCAFL